MLAIVGRLGSWRLSLLYCHHPASWTAWAGRLGSSVLIVSVPNHALPNAACRPDGSIVWLPVWPGNLPCATNWTVRSSVPPTGTCVPGAGGVTTCQPLVVVIELIVSTSVPVLRMRRTLVSCTVLFGGWTSMSYR